MSLKSFQYVRPNTVDEVVALLGAHGTAARLLAGGTDLLVRFRLGHVRPAIVIDLKRADGLSDRITEADSSLRVGARVVMADLIGDERIRRHFPALVEAARVVGSMQIRHRATLAGNICNASPAADTAPALLVYGALVNVIGRTGSRRVPVADFFTGPGKTVLAADEMVAAIDLPIPSAPVGAAFGRLTRRRGVDLASLNVCCLVTLSGKTRIALGAVAPRPVLIQEDNSDAMLDRVMAHTSPISDVRASREYRAAMLPVFIQRTLKIATDRLQRGHA
jgi:CO/xanthine dehydrogenase FAD-binding subunit